MVRCFVVQVDTEEKALVDPRTVLSVILGGGAGTRLFPLTKRRAKPAVSSANIGCGSLRSVCRLT